MSFEYVKKLAPKQTVKYELGCDLGTLIVRPATRSNKDWMRVILKRVDKFGAAKNVTLEKVMHNENVDLALFAKHIVVGWEGVVDDEGKQAEHSEENCLAFLRAVLHSSPDIWDGLVAFATDPANFRDEIVDQAAVEDMGKN